MPLRNYNDKGHCIISAPRLIFLRQFLQNLHPRFSNVLDELVNILTAVSHGSPLFNCLFQWDYFKIMNIEMSQLNAIQLIIMYVTLFAGFSRQEKEEEKET